MALLVSSLLLLQGCASGNRPLQLVSGKGALYPPTAFDQGIEGEVVVAYNVTVEGLVEQARIVSASPAGVFDEAALIAVRSWRFNPPKVNGKPQSAPNRHSTLTFEISDGGKYDKY